MRGVPVEPAGYDRKSCGLIKFNLQEPILGARSRGVDRDDVCGYSGDSLLLKVSSMAKYHQEKLFASEELGTRRRQGNTMFNVLSVVGRP